MPIGVKVHKKNGLKSLGILDLDIFWDYFPKSDVTAPKHSLCPMCHLALVQNLGE